LIEVTLRILLVEDDERGFAATEALLDGIRVHPCVPPRFLARRRRSLFLLLRVSFLL
jgi:hypothetical protein